MDFVGIWEGLGRNPTTEDWMRKRLNSEYFCMMSRNKTLCIDRNAVELQTIIAAESSNNGGKRFAFFTVRAEREECYASQR